VCFPGHSMWLCQVETNLPRQFVMPERHRDNKLAHCLKSQAYTETAINKDPTSFLAACKKELCS
jgi:hypothetical protein